MLAGESRLAPRQGGCEMIHEAKHLLLILLLVVTAISVAVYCVA